MILLITSPSGLRMCFLVSRVLKRTAFAVLTCVFAMVGALVGCAAGALIGQTKEIGCSRGARIGAFSGAVLSIEMLESTAVGGQWSLMDIFVSLVNGKIFQEWVGEAMLAANQSQGGIVRPTTLDDHLSILDICNTRGMPPDSVQKLPVFVVSSQEMQKTSEYEIPCAICLQDLDEGDTARGLPKCRHQFHMACIDRWLTIDASCPTCRQHVG